jgi:23S rRNA pseudouridine1911/1915/1917 synthase
LAHIGCPVLCDRLYGGRSKITLGEVVSGRKDENVILARQALHARRLKLTHPSTREPIEFQAPLPQDMKRVLAEFERYRTV